jgi:hypothetical protein
VVSWTVYFDKVPGLLDVDPDLLAARLDLLSDEERTLLEERLARKEMGM